MQNINYENIGINESEKLAEDSIREIFTRSMPGCRVLCNTILPTNGHIDTCPSTAEYDIIVVCKYGVIHFEVKGWSGNALFKRNDRCGNSRWFVEFDENTVLERPNALRQCNAKTKMLRRELGIYTQHYVLFTNNDLHIAPDMSPFLFTLEQASYLPRFVRLRHREVSPDFLGPKTIKIIADTIEEAGQLTTPTQHVRNVQEYLENKEKRSEKGQGVTRTNRDTFENFNAESKTPSVVQNPAKRNPLVELFRDYSAFRVNQGFWHARPATSFIALPH